MSTERRYTISLVVPVHNSVGILATLIERSIAVLNECSADHEVVLVDDGSNDGSWEEITRLAEIHQQVRGLRLSRNFGQHNALLAGVRSSDMDLIVTLDDDLEQPPESIPVLLEALDESHDLVYGLSSLAAGERHGHFRDLGSRSVRGLMSKMLGVDFATSISPLKLFRTSLRDAFVGASGPSVSLDALLAWSTRRVRTVDVAFEPRASGSSGYTLVRQIRHAMLEITGFSTVPLRLASLVGFVTVGFGFAVLAYVFVRFLTQGGEVPGFTFLSSLIVVFAGVQLFSLGVLGEYLARVHEQSIGRPTYMIAEEVD